MKNVILTLISLLFISSCGGSEARIDAILKLDAKDENGKSIYEANCSRCHGSDGSGTSLGPGIKSENDEEEIIEVTIEGEGSMPAFDHLSDQEIADLTKYSKSL